MAHHDLCFGCGAANVFGLHLEPVGEGEWRFFVKQDHQGPHGALHEGVLAAALVEAMALAAGGDPPSRHEVQTRGRAPIGTFVRVEASLRHDGSASATAYGEDGAVFGCAWGTFAPAPGGQHQG